MYLDNIYIQEIMKEWKADAGIKHFILWKYDRRNNILNIYTDRPGPMIGCMGERVARFTDKFRYYNKNIIINFEETDGLV